MLWENMDTWGFFSCGILSECSGRTMVINCGILRSEAARSLFLVALERTSWKARLAHWGKVAKQRILFAEHPRLS